MESLAKRDALRVTAQAAELERAFYEGLASWLGTWGWTRTSSSSAFWPVRQEAAPWTCAAFSVLHETPCPKVPESLSP